MEDKNIKPILQNALEEEIPSSEVNLWTSVKESLVARRVQQGEKMNRIQSRPRRMQSIALAALIIASLMAIALLTPQGRAFAQRIFLFFTVTEEKSYPIPTEQVYAVPATETPVPTYVLPVQPVEVVTEPVKTPELPDKSCSSPEAQSGYFCQIKALEAQAGFDAKELPYDPKGMKFSEAAFDPDTKVIHMEFEANPGGGSLFLRQGLGEFPSTSQWGQVPTDAIQQVTVNGQYAELVSGGFAVYPNATEAVWEPGGLLRLHWRDGDRWYSLEKMGDPYPIEWLGENEMIVLAESLVDERPLDAVPPVDPENLASVKAAEELAGFDILEPTLLPDGYELKRVAWSDNTARLIYGPKDSADAALAIFMGPVENSQAGRCLDCPAGTTETVQIGPWQGWYWRGIFNMGAGANVQPTPTPIWEPDARAWHLSWNTDTLWFSMSSFSSEGYGGEINKETLIKIAESLK